MAQARLTKEDLQQELKIIEAAKKDRRHFGTLYEKYYRQIFLFVFKRTGDEDVCGDVVSQVFMKAMVNLPKYQFKGVPFSAWLYRIASNEVNQHFRGQKGDRTVSMDRTQIDRVLGMVDETRMPDHVECYQEVMLETLEELKPEDVQIVELRFFEERPFKEVAFILGITENNAKVRVYRIVERMKKKLAEKIGGDIT